MEIADNEGISQRQVRVFVQLNPHGWQTVRDISAATGVKKGTVSKFLARFVKAGICEAAVQPPGYRYRLLPDANKRNPALMENLMAQAEIYRRWGVPYAPTVEAELPRQHAGWFGTQTRRIPTVKFDASRLTRTVLADLKQNICELSEIGEGKFDAVYKLAVRSFRAGDDGTLADGLVAMGLVTPGRGAVIRGYLWSRAHELMERERRTELGITRARWRYGAPCMLDPGEPTQNDLRQDAAHKAADGAIYNIADGMLLNGKHTWPGREWGCKCSSNAIIPDLENS